MTDRTVFAPGVPCWVDTWQPDAATAASFYAALMGWETEIPTWDAAGPRYVMCRRDGRDVAAIGEGPSIGAPPAASPPPPRGARPARPRRPPGREPPARRGRSVRRRSVRRHSVRRRSARGRFRLDHLRPGR